MLTLVKGSAASEGPRIHVERTGSGPAEVLLIHGLGSRGQDFSSLNADLAPGRSVLAPDLRGHGESEAALPVTLGDFASDLLPLLDEGPPKVVVGFSFGSWVAMELWRTRPEAVESLVLVDPALTYGPLFEWASRGGPGRERVRAFLKRTADALGLDSLGRRLLSPIVARQRAVDRITAVYYASDLEEMIALMRENPLTRDLDEEGLEMNARSVLAADHPTLLAGLDATGKPEDQDRPEGSGVVPIVLYGEHSMLTGRSRSEAFAAAIGGRAVGYEGGHVAHLEAPGAVAAEIEQLLA